MCDEHNIDIEMKTDKKDKQTINQIDGWNIEVKFNENGFSRGIHQRKIFCLLGADKKYKERYNIFVEA